MTGVGRAVSVPSLSRLWTLLQASSCEKGVGIIKLMGRDAGFVAAHAALASNLVRLRHAWGRGGKGRGGA